MALLGSIVALLALAVAGAIYQAIATERAERAYPPPGEMVDVGASSHPLPLCPNNEQPATALR